MRGWGEEDGRMGDGGSEGERVGGAGWEMKGTISISTNGCVFLPLQ